MPRHCAARHKTDLAASKAQIPALHRRPPPSRDDPNLPISPQGGLDVAAARGRLFAGRKRR
jgi:hypothetical protein